MTYQSRLEAIKAYLRRNEELLSRWDKGKVEVHFSGVSISFSIQEIDEGATVERENLTKEKQP